MKAVGKIASKDRNHWMVDLMYHPFWQPNGNDNNDDYDNSDDNDDNNDDNDDNYDEEEGSGQRKSKKIKETHGHLKKMPL